MTWQDFDEFTRLLNELRDRMTTLDRVFPSGSPASLNLAQRQAIQAADEAWAKFREKAKSLGAPLD